VRAARFHAPGVVTVDELPDPEPGPGELVLRVRAASICGTDRRIAAHGHFKLPAGTPRVLGHEFAGEVVAVGRGAERFAPGDRLSVTPNVGCGHCPACRGGRNQMCPDYEAFGITIDGGFAEFVRIPERAIARGNVFPLPDSVSFRAAALAEPLSCCVSASRGLAIRPESTVLVMGAGPIGVLHVRLAKLAGARKVIVTNNRRARLEVAQRFGADVLVSPREEDLAEVVARETEGRGVDVAITCVSSAAVQSQAVDLLATDGRVNFFAGLSGPDRPVIDTNRVHYRALTLTGTTGSSNADYLAALELLRDGRIDAESLVTGVFGLGEIDAALAAAASGEGMKAMIEFPAAPAH
jgi:L-iditol 2-dehydrogenase